MFLGAIRSDKNIKSGSLVKFFKKDALILFRYEFNDFSRVFSIRKKNFLLFKEFIGFSIEELGLQR